MRRIIGFLAAALTAGLFGGPPPANASAFLAINGGTWSYSAAAASSPAGTAYYWGLSLGVGSVSYAYAYSYSFPFGGAAAYAIARAGFGWRGAWYAYGLADPQADIGLGIPDISGIPLSTLVNTSDSADLGSEVSSDASSAPSSPAPYTLDTDGSTGPIDGITFSPAGDSSSETNAVDELALIVVSSDLNAQTDFCSAVGDSCSATEEGETNASGDVTDIADVVNDLGSSVVATEIDIDPTDLSSGGTFSFADIPGTSSSSQYILVEEGDPVPEPGTILLLGQGLLLIGLIAAGRRRQRS